MNLWAPVALGAAGEIHATREGRDRIVPAASTLEVRVVGRIGLVAPACGRMALVHVLHGRALRGWRRDDRGRRDDASYCQHNTCRHCADLSPQVHSGPFL